MDSVPFDFVVSDAMLMWLCREWLANYYRRRVRDKSVPIPQDAG